jgi:23S rRNA pseudouridine2604 synthase
VEQIDKNRFKIILTQGLNRQIRRMCEYLDFKVMKLKRVRIMNIKLDIPIGKWRYLSDSEMNEINRLISSSSKTHIDPEE